MPRGPWVRSCRKKKSTHIVRNSVELHNMLYTLGVNLHEQTLSFAAADGIENPTL